jgi:hypothetical protein
MAAPTRFWISVPSRPGWSAISSSHLVEEIPEPDAKGLRDRKQGEIPRVNYFLPLGMA